MPMVPFFEFFPALAEEETRSVTLLHDCGPVPRGEYAFLELYCDEPGCDCENVLINVLDPRDRHLATINHALEPRWSRKAGVARTFLDPLNRQGPHAAGLLALFREVVCDRAYEDRLRRHRALVREAVDSSRACGAAATRLTSARVPRNAPCTCGSGRKQKSCCGAPRSSRSPLRPGAG